MELKIIVPTHIWELAQVQKEWFDMMSYDRRYRDVGVELFHEQGEAPSGRNIRQKYTDIYAGDDVYVHWLDCDNLIHGSILAKLYDLEYEYDYTPKIFIFSQIWHTNGPKRLNAKPENMHPCKCDIAQLFVHGSFLKDMVWSSAYENDGQFIEELYKRYPNDFIFVNDVNVWYNAMKPHSTLFNGQIIEIA
jgi:hypothetical protein